MSYDASAGGPTNDDRDEMRETSPIPVVRDGMPDPRGKAPSRVPTIITTVFLGPFGAIAAALSARNAHTKGFPRGVYWSTFIITWAAHLLLVAGVIVAWLLGAFDSFLASSDADDSPSPTVVTATATVTPSASASSAASSPASAASSATASSSAAFPSGAKLCTQNVGAGSSTSCDFASAVATAYARAGAGTGNRTVQATSSVTGQSYTMSCTTAAATGLTTCTGGNGATVYIR